MTNFNLPQHSLGQDPENIAKVKADIKKYKKAIKDMKDNMLKPSVSLWVIFAASAFSGIPNEALKVIAYILGFYFYYKVVKTGDSSLTKETKYENIQHIKKSLLYDVNSLPNGIQKKRVLKCIKRIQKKHENFFEKNTKSWFGIKRAPLIFMASYIFYAACFLDSIYVFHFTGKLFL
ncbi:hypothetical protein [Providencia rettgeri]|uniref:hypothetical protein n=1 Tax=Providencia rettgeri TaxID=587 RepID=UPI0023604524|nr:hypothetical protein [Providencia rettgeri]